MCYEEMIDFDTGSLTPKHLSGAYVLSAVLVAQGLSLVPYRRANPMYFRRMNTQPVWTIYMLQLLI